MTDHANEFRALWQTLVTDSGQAPTVQGELIRAVGRMRDEAERNGNANWDEGYELFDELSDYTVKWCKSRP